MSMNLNLVKIIIGNKPEDKKAYVSEYMRLFPHFNKKQLGDNWERHVNTGVLLIIIDIDTGHLISALRMTIDGSSFWELHSNFIRSIPHISQINVDELMNTNQTSTSNKKTKSNYNIDELLDIISVKGYEKLSDDQKQFLEKYSKK